jgi:hypothetical protein
MDRYDYVQFMVNHDLNYDRLNIVQEQTAKDLVDMISDRFNRTWLDFVVAVVPELKTWAYYSMYLKYMEYIEPLYSRYENGEIPHVKRALRQAYVRMRGGEATDDIMVTRIEGHVKNEDAKPKKAPRFFVGYDAGCMFANELPEFIKICFSKQFFYRRGEDYFTVYVFSKPRMSEIQEVFDRIARGLDNHEHIICIYSDDSVWAKGGPDGFSCNVDAISCDSSVQASGFYLSGLQMGNFDNERSIGLIEQCKLPIRVRTRDKARKISVQRVQDGKVSPFEGSGTVLTTINNHSMSLSCVSSWINLGIYTKEAIVFAGSLVGMDLEVSEDFKHTPEKLQFLKYSPILGTDGKYYMSRNLGCILRGLGKVNGDLTNVQLAMTQREFKYTPWPVRMDIYTSKVVQSYCHEHPNIILDALRDRFAVPVINTESVSQIEYDCPTTQLVAESLANRYDITLHDLEQLSDQIRSIHLGDVVVSDVLSNIYRVDYGM